MAEKRWEKPAEEEKKRTIRAPTESSLDLRVDEVKKNSAYGPIAPSFQNRKHFLHNKEAREREL